MDWQFLSTLFKIIIFLPFILVLIYLCAKLGGSKLQHLQNGKFMKILERVPLSKDNAILAVKIGEKGYVISSSSGRVEVLMELNEEELLQVQKPNAMPDFINFKQYEAMDIGRYLNKLKLKKEDKHE